MKTFRIKTEVKQTCMEGHSGPILKIIVLEPSKIFKYRSAADNVADSVKIITASSDNSLLLWDYEKMSVVSKVKSAKTSEITCATFLFKCNLVGTGHEDGQIRLWNLEISSSIQLNSGDSQKRHLNTISCITSIIWND